jgi:hypothetical protein
MDFFDRGSAVSCCGFLRGNVDVFGPQAILRTIRRQFVKLTVQAGLHDMQGNLHNVFATRVVSQSRLHFLLLIFLQSVGSETLKHPPNN